MIFYYDPKRSFFHYCFIIAVNRYCFLIVEMILCNLTHKIHYSFLVISSTTTRKDSTIITELLLVTSEPPTTVDSFETKGGMIK